MLFSGEFNECLSPQVQQLTRLIDVVVVKGSKKPVKLFTFDLMPELLKPQYGNHGVTGYQSENMKVKQRNKKKKDFLLKVKEDDIQTYKLFTRNRQI